ncbi:MAG: hypothetical protein V7K67_13085, partial [Nostoc sp.]|uniref:hypothetical protein n=1 Tax=Nostoc sp. TaxID=1180 RepID=UPI002FF66FD9
QILQASRLVEAENLRRQLLRIPAINGGGGCQFMSVMHFHLRQKKSEKPRENITKEVIGLLNPAFGNTCVDSEDPKK